MTAKKPKGKGVAVIIAIGGKPKGDMKKYGKMPIKKGRFQMGDKYRHNPYHRGFEQHLNLIADGAAELGSKETGEVDTDYPRSLSELAETETPYGHDYDVRELLSAMGAGDKTHEMAAGEQVDMEYLRRTQPHLFDREPSKFASGGAGQRRRRGPGARSTEGRAGLRQALADPEQGPESFYPKGTNLALSEDDPMTFALSILKSHL